MSKIGKLPIEMKDGINVQIAGQVVSVSGPKGQADYTVPSGITVEMEDGKLVVKQVNPNDMGTRAMFGLTRANLANVVKGVSDGFERKLELVGVGFRSQMQGTDLVLSLGYSHPVKFSPSKGVSIAIVDNVIVVSGTDKAAVGLDASRIRAIREPEPYKGKGIKYQGEHIKRKAGKAAKAVGGK